MFRIITILVMAGSLSACYEPTPSAPPEAAGTIDVPTYMTSVADALIDTAVKNRYNLRRFRGELKRELGKIYSERRVDSSKFLKSDLERDGWKGETIYHFGLDACVECIVFVNREGIIVGPVGPDTKAANKSSLLTGQQPFNLTPGSTQSRP